MNRRMGLVSMVIVAAAGLPVMPGCSTAPKTEAGRAEIQQEAADSLAKARKSDPTIGPLLDKAAGYAVFPSVGKGAIGVGGAYGRGVLFESGAATGYCDLTQATIGFQLGGQAYTEIIAFENADAVGRFKSGNFAFAAQATAVALKSGVGTSAKYTDGVAVFTMDEAGLMYEASVGGQKFSYQSK